MGIKTIFLSVVLSHLCAATVNDTALMVKGIEYYLPPRLKLNTTHFTEIWKGFIGGMIDSFVSDSIEILNSRSNSTNSTQNQTQPNNSFDTVITRFMPSFYIILILISLPLNALALFTFTCWIQEKKPAVIYMSHLACVDLLFALLLPLKIHYYLNSLNWVFGEVACRVVTAAYYCYMYCSILLMMCMSVDRMLAVVFPIISLTWRSTKNASRICVLVWLLSLTGTVPLLIRDLTYTYNGSVTCLDTQNYDQQLLVYMHMFSIFICISFFLPLVVTFFSYFTIVYVLLMKSDKIASSSSSSSDKQRRAIIMAITVLTGFVVCFGPSNVILLYFCIEVATGNIDESNSLYCNYMLAVCLGSASVFLDPLLYYYGSSQYRQMIQSVLRRRQKNQQHRS